MRYHFKLDFIYEISKSKTILKKIIKTSILKVSLPKMMSDTETVYRIWDLKLFAHKLPRQNLDNWPLSNNKDQNLCHPCAYRAIPESFIRNKLRFSFLSKFQNLRPCMHNKDRSDWLPPLMLFFSCLLPHYSIFGCYSKHYQFLFWSTNAQSDHLFHKSKYWIYKWRSNYSHHAKSWKPKFRHK